MKWFPTLFRRRPLILTWIGVLVSTACFTVYAQVPTAPDAKDPTQWIVSAIVIAGVILNLIWSFRNQRQKDVVSELTALVDVKDKRATELERQKAEQEAHHEKVVAQYALKLAQSEKKVTNLEISNEAVVSTSLQMKAILKRLRLEGKWPGHEEMIHDTDSQYHDG